MNDADDNRSFLEADYCLWLDTLLLVKGCTKGHIAAEIRHQAKKLAKNDTELGHARGLTDAAVRNWFTRSSLPAENKPVLLEALKLIVQKEISARPNGLATKLDFKDLCAEIQRTHKQSTKRGKAIADISTKLFENEALVHAVGPLSEIDPADLGLGTWLFDGELAPYCAREVDVEIAKVLDSDAKFLFLVGPPKSGKTRTLLEGLRKSRYSNFDLYWISAALGSIDQVIVEVSRLKSANAVFVLDDLQRLRFDNDSGLNFHKFMQLSELGIVAGTLHVSALESWKNSQIDHRESPLHYPSSKLIKQIVDASLNLNPNLNDEELYAASESLKGTQADSEEITYLPAWLASVEALVAQFNLLSRGRAIEQSVARAIIDAKVLHPRGVSLQELKLLAEQAFAFSNKNGIWSNRAWEDTLESISTGISPGSPHSVIVRNPDNPDLYAVLDAVWDRVLPDSWDTSHIILQPDLVEQASTSAVSQGYPKAAISLIQRYGQHRNTQLNRILGLAHQTNGDVDEAKKIFLNAISSGDDEARPFLFDILMAEGRLDEAEEILDQTRDSDLGLYHFGMGGIAILKSDHETAVRHLEEAKKAGYPEAQRSLAALKLFSYDFDSALDLATQADENGSLGAPLVLGLVNFALGRLEEAEKQFLRLKGTPDAALGLAKIQVKRGDYRKARRWFEECLELAEFFRSRSLIFGYSAELQPIAQYGLLGAAAADELNDYVIEILDQYFSKNLPPWDRLQAHFGNAEFLHGILLEMENHLKKLAKSEQGTEEIVQTHYFNLGLVQLALGDFSNAIESFRSGVEGTATRNNIGLAQLKLGDFESALAAFQSTIEVGDSFGYACAVDLLYELGRYDECRVYAQALADSNYVVGLNALGLLCLNEGSIDEAIKFFERAKSFPNAIHNLGVAHKALNNSQLARSYFQLAARLGVFVSFAELGVIELDEGNKAGAKNLYETAAKNGAAVGYFYLGDMFHDEGDHSEALRNFCFGAARGHRESITGVGYYLESYEHFEDAKVWYLKAATMGSTWAMVNLGDLLVGENDFYLAEYWLTKAFNNGEHGAATELVDLFESQGQLEKVDFWKSIIERGSREG